MDISDNQPIEQRRFHQPEQLSASLWSRAAAGRSTFLTPLHIIRYKGPRVATVRMSAHRVWELLFGMAGHGTLDCGHARYDVGPGTAVWIPPGQMHREIGDQQDWDTLWIGLDGDALATLPSHHATCCGHAESLRPWINALWNWQGRQWGAIGPELDAQTLFIFHTLQRLMADVPRPVHWLTRVIDHMHEHLDAEIDMEELAAVADYSVGHFQRAFKKETQVTPLAYLTQLRLRTALTLLQESAHPIRVVADMVGYRDPLYFSRLCRQQYGQSPRELRRRHQDPIPL